MCFTRRHRKLQKNQIVPYPCKPKTQNLKRLRQSPNTSAIL